MPSECHIEIVIFIISASPRSKCSPDRLVLDTSDWLTGGSYVGNYVEKPSCWRVTSRFWLVRSDMNPSTDITGRQDTHSTVA